MPCIGIKYLSKLLNQYTMWHTPPYKTKLSKLKFLCLKRLFYPKGIKDIMLVLKNHWAKSLHSNIYSWFSVYFVQNKN